MTELQKRVKHALSDAEQFREWLAQFYRDHAAYIDTTIGPYCDVYARAVDRIAFVEGVIQENLHLLLDHDPAQVVAHWADGELSARYTEKLKGLAA